MKRRLAALLCALALSLSLAGCWSSDVSDEGNDFWEEPPEQEADNSPLTPITSFALPYLQGVTLDPLTCPDGMQQVLGALLYEGLFALDESFAPQTFCAAAMNAATTARATPFICATTPAFPMAAP